MSNQTPGVPCFVTQNPGAAEERARRPWGSPLRSSSPCGATPRAAHLRPWRWKAFRSRPRISVRGRGTGSWLWGHGTSRLLPVGRTNDPSAL